MRDCQDSPRPGTEGYDWWIGAKTKAWARDLVQVKEDNMSKELHGAVIRLDLKLLLEMLDFKGGDIRRVYTDDGYIHSNFCSILIEHPDLPVVPLGQMAVPITPSYTKYFGDNGGLIRIERTDPPKKQTA